MADRSRRRGGLASVLALFAVGSCSSTVDSRARLLDDECKDTPCATEGRAEEVTGITADSIGFRLGPGIGKVTIPLSTFSDLGSDSFSLELLIGGEGTYTARLMQTTCASDAAPCNTPQLITQVAGRASDTPSWRSAGSYSGSSSAFSGFYVEIESDPSASSVEVIDIRYDTFDSITCSVSAPGRR